MTDIALQMIDGLPSQPPTFDLALAGADIDTDDGLETAVILSLFLDRRADETDLIPDGTSNRRGWYADEWADGDRIGSRLWLLGREKQTPDVLRRAEEYAEEALAWLLEDGVARQVQVSAEAVAPGVLGLSIGITRADNARWDRHWNVQLQAM